jgi:hypothetical protein
MTPAAWIMLGAAIASPIFTVAFWLLRRPIGRIDRLEAAVFGESGVNMKLAKYVTTDAFEKRMGTIDTHLAGVSEEGQRREDRILAAINQQGQRLEGSLGEVKADIRAQSGRIDLLHQKPNA